jgi:thiol-disulfide isomerase/thioredoxin
MPLIDKLSSELFDSGVRVIKVNTESGNGGSIAADNNVEAMPSLHFFKNGKKLGFFMGSDINAVEKSIRSYANV